MQYLLFIAIMLIYIFRVFSQAQKKAREEAERRRRANEQAQQQNPTTIPAPLTPEERMREIFRETEMKTKPYGSGRTISQTQRREKPAQQRQILQPQTITPTVSSQIQKQKEPQPFLTAELNTLQGTLSTPSDDYIKKTQVSDANKPQSTGPKIKFILRDAVIAKIILDRPEW